MTTRLLLALAIALSVDCRAGSSPDAASFALQRVVKLRTPADKPSAVARVREFATVLGGGERFLVIRPTPSISRERFEDGLRALGREPGVEAVYADTLDYPRRVALHALPPIGKDADARAGAQDAACRIFPHCGSHNPAWAALQVGADLAEGIVKRAVSASDKGGTLAKVAVVDSGFDTKGQAASIDAASFTTAKGHDSAGDKDIDPDGHGTAVSGMIAGRQVGITHQLDLEVYRVTEPHGGGSVSHALLSAAIEKACEKSDVVNVSWGSLADEIGFARPEDELWYGKAAKRGCLVVKAAGNSGYKSAPIPGKAPGLEAPILTVAASDQFSDDAPFSTSGGIFGPGAGVYSLLSSQHEYGEDTTKQACEVGKARVGPVDGTSFAAPLVSGVAAQVITILRSRGALPADPAKKIRLVKSILMASAEWSKESGSRRPVVNALAASLIAAVAAESLQSSADLIAAARKGADVQKGCSRDVKDCAREKDCTAKKECVNELRFHFLACVPPPPGAKAAPELNRRLFDSLRQLDERELVIQLIDRLPPKSDLVGDATKELSRHWRDVLDEKGTRVDIGHATEALNLLYAARRSDLSGGFDVPGKLRQLLRSFSLSGLAYFREPLGKSNRSATEQQSAKLTEVFRALPVDEQVALVREMPLGGSLAAEIDYLYYLHENQALLPEATRGALRERLPRIAEAWIEGKLGPLPYLHVPAADMLIESLPDGKERLARALAGKLDRNKTFLYEYAMESKTALGKERLPVIESLASSPDIRDDDFTHTLSEALATLMRDGTPEIVTRTVRRLLLESPNATLPREATAWFESSVTDRHKALAADGFFPKFVAKQIEWGIEVLSQRKPSWYRYGLAIRNITRALGHNDALFPKEARKEMFAGPTGKQFQRFLDVAAGTLARAPALAPQDTALRGPLEIVETVLADLPKYREAGAEPLLLAGLVALKDDIQRNPKKYDQSLRIAIARLYGLPE